MLLFLLIAGTVIGLDRLTKWLVVQNLAPGREIHIIDDWVRLTHIKNTGAAFGLFPGSTLPLIVVSLVASFVVAWLAVRHRARASRVIPLGLILGGAIGNLVDRIGSGRVTDFILVGIPRGPSWPVFNVADSAVTIGVAILAFGVYFQRHPADPAPADMALGPSGSAGGPPAERVSGAPDSAEPPPAEGAPSDALPGHGD